MSNELGTAKLLTPLDAPLGAVVNDLDVSRPLPPRVILDLKQGLLDHQMLIFKGQDLTQEQLKAFATYFGSVFQSPPDVPVLASATGGTAPDVVLVANVDGGYTAAVSYRHTRTITANSRRVLQRVSLAGSRPF